MTNWVNAPDEWKLEKKHSSHNKLSSCPCDGQNPLSLSISEYCRVYSRIINTVQLTRSHWLAQLVAPSAAGCLKNTGGRGQVLNHSTQKSEFLQSLVISNSTLKWFNTDNFKNSFTQNYVFKPPWSLFWVPFQINSSSLSNQPHPGKQHCLLQAFILCFRIWTCI